MPTSDPEAMVRCEAALPVCCAGPDGMALVTVLLEPAAGVLPLPVPVGYEPVPCVGATTVSEVSVDGDEPPLPPVGIEWPAVAVEQSSSDEPAPP